MSDRDGSIGPPGSGEETPTGPQWDGLDLTPAGGTPEPPSGLPRLAIAAAGLIAIVLAVVFAWPSGDDEPPVQTAAGTPPPAASTPPVPTETVTVVTGTTRTNPPPSNFSGTKTIQDLSFAYGTARGPFGSLIGDGDEFHFVSTAVAQAILALTTQWGAPYTCTIDAGRVTGCAKTAQSAAAPKPGEPATLRVLQLDPPVSITASDGNRPGVDVRGEVTVGGVTEDATVRVRDGGVAIEEGRTYRCTFGGSGLLTDCR